jgi:hypothetical protein
MGCCGGNRFSEGWIGHEAQVYSVATKKLIMLRTAPHHILALGKSLYYKHQS